MVKCPSFGNLPSPVSPLTSISSPHFGVFIYLTLSLDETLQSPKGRDPVLKRDLGEKPYFMPIGIWKAVGLSVGKLAKYKQRVRGWP